MQRNSAVACLPESVEKRTVAHERSATRRNAQCCNVIKGIDPMSNHAPLIHSYSHPHEAIKIAACSPSSPEDPSETAQKYRSK